MDQLDHSNRYLRQTTFPGLGEEGQHKLGGASVLVVGCGALGGTITDLMVRAGIGDLVVCDPDAPDLPNLHRQSLFDEDDVRSGENKAVLGARRLSRCNSQVGVKGIAARVDEGNVDSLVSGMDLVMDASDNFETRLAVNAACVRAGVPWVYGGAVASMGMSMNIIPGQGPCLACLFPEAPPPGTIQTNETVGVLNVTPHVVASLQVAEGVKILVGSPEVRRTLLYLDLWTNEWREVKVGPRPGCEICGGRAGGGKGL